MLNIDEEVKKVLNEVGPGRMSSTAYDTAWVARLGEIDKDLSDQAVNWLLENQLPDGSWGASDVFYYHDRVISTLIAMIALKEHGGNSHHQAQVEKGVEALERITSDGEHSFASDLNGATVAFEMVAPILLAEAKELGIIKQQGERILGRLSNMRQEKMRKLAGYKINRYVTPAFSAEMAGIDDQYMLEVENLQEANGSIGHSPSATAYFALRVKPGDAKAIDYIKSSVAKNGGAPDLYPFDVYERAWVLWNLSLTDYFEGDKRSFADPILDYLAAAWKPGQGIGFSKDYSVIDGDDTIITCELFNKFGYPTDLNTVLSFEEEEYFRCYQLEVGISPSVNIHALMTLRDFDYPLEHPSVRKVFQFLDTQKSGDFWVDKWNSSSFYTSSHYVIACAKFKNAIAQPTVDWILKNQRADGSWGTFGSTTEETAYCLQALSIWSRHVRSVPQDVIRRGRTWLLEHYDLPHSPIWIGKGLYTPQWVSCSAILSAMLLTVSY